MESITIKFTANGQTLTGGGLFCASNTVRYIIAEFDLGDNWQGYDSVRAVWSTDFKCISTVLDPSGSCTVPHEVLERRGKVSVNLVGSILEDDELTDRLTTYPALAITVDANAKICGTETAEVTPSQFEQYVAIVIAEVEKVTGMTAVAQALPEGSEPTANYSDGVLTLGIPKGDTGATGNGISRVEFNEDYSLTFYFTDSEPFTTPSIRGAQGARGYGIASVEKIDSTGLVDTYRITFEDPSVQPTTFTVTNGEEGPQGPRGYTGETGNGIDRIELTDTTGAVKTYTIYFTDGSTYDFEVTDGEVTLAELASVLPTDTASGAIASFEDGSDLFDYLSCVVEINPVQAGSGTPSPDNVRPITGWTGCEVVVSPTEDAQDGTTYPVSWQTEAGTVYGGTVDLVTGVLTVTWASDDMGTLNWAYNSVYNFFTVDIIGKANGATNLISSGYPFGNVWSSSSDFVIAGNGSYPSIYIKDSRYIDATAFKTAMNGVQLVYELATPQTYQLDPVQVACLLGRNNVWADCGDIKEVKYKADVQLWVEKMLNA